MPANHSISRIDSGLSRRSRSPYQQQDAIHLREDSQGHIEGVEYLTSLSGIDSQDEAKHDSHRPSVSSMSSQSSKPRRRSSAGYARRQSRPISTRSKPARRKPSYPSDPVSIDLQDTIRLCPSPGRRPSAQFTLSSPETPGKDAVSSGDDSDVSPLSLPSRSRRSIRKSPLLNRDLLQFVNGQTEGRDEMFEDVDMEMIFALSLSEGEGPVAAKGVREGKRGEGESPNGMDMVGNRSSNASTAARPVDLKAKDAKARGGRTGENTQGPSVRGWNPTFSFQGS